MKLGQDSLDLWMNSYLTLHQPLAKAVISESRIASLEICDFHLLGHQLSERPYFSELWCENYVKGSIFMGTIVVLMSIDF